jgi:hypothetical protein
LKWCGRGFAATALHLNHALTEGLESGEGSRCMPTECSAVLAASRVKLRCATPLRALDPAARGAGLSVQTALAVSVVEIKEKIMKRKNKITIELPIEFIELCEGDGVTPEIVLRGFIADLAGIHNWVANPRADGYSSNGSDERSMAQEYYERVGYPYWHK